MSREVCGICWCPYDEDTGECACKVPSDCADSHQPVAWYHVPYPGNGNSPMVSLSQHHEPSLYGAVVPLYIAPPIMEPEIKVDKEAPVAWLFTNVQSGESDFCFCADEHDHDREMWHRQPLYTSHLKCKPLTEEEIEKAYREIWRNLPSEFDHTSSGWIELGIRYAERAHGIGD